MCLFVEIFDLSVFYTDHLIWPELLWKTWQLFEKLYNFFEKIADFFEKNDQKNPQKFTWGGLSDPKTA